MEATILIADDSIKNLKILQEYLRQADANYTIFEANNGLECCEIAEAEDLDLILLDWEMPVMSGIDALRKLKANPKTFEIPVIMVTGKTEVNDLKEAFDAGVMDYVEKPVLEIELQVRVRSALALSYAQKELKAKHQKLEEAKKESDDLLLNILPAEVAEELKQFQEVFPRQFEQVSVLFTDFKGFSSITQEMSPLQIIQRLTEVFLMIELITDKRGIEKIKTIGDAFMGAGGIPIANKTNAIDAVLAGWEIQEAMSAYREAKLAKGEPCFECRLGIHTGSVVAGVIGQSKFAYDIWGSSVNVAARMESEGECGKVNISGDTYKLVNSFFDCEYRGKRPIKNLGEVDMYFVKQIKKDLSVNGEGLEPNEAFWELRRQKA